MQLVLDGQNFQRSIFLLLVDDTEQNSLLVGYLFGNEPNLTIWEPRGSTSGFWVSVFLGHHR